MDVRTQLQSLLGDGYVIERELGGGMSRVFVAEDKALGRKVVVKVLPPELAAEVNVERFRREIQLAARLQHPNIVPLLNAADKGDLLWYSMPFKWMFGTNTAWSGAIVGALGDKARAVELLRHSKEQGAALDTWNYAPQLDALRGYPPFEELIRPQR